MLDISNNSEYIWTVSFVPLPTPSTTSTSSSLPASSSQIPSEPNNKPTIIGAVIGSLAGGILLTIGCFFLYKGYQRRQNLRSGSKNEIGSTQVVHHHGREA